MLSVDSTYLGSPRHTFPPGDGTLTPATAYPEAHWLPLFLNSFLIFQGGVVKLG